MVLDIQSFFSKPFKSKGRPLLNQIPVNVSHNAGMGVSTNYNQKQKFWKWFKSRPELNSPVMIRVDDTISDVDFFNIDGSPLGRNKKMQAEKFWDDNFLYERLKSVQYDRLVTGSGFIWTGKPSVEQMKEVIERIINKFSFAGINMREVSDRLLLRAIDEDLRAPRVVDYVPSSTVVIEHDRYDIKRYIQYFGAYSESFTPDEIIHIPLIRADGKVDGFTPIESLGYELVLLWAIKENMLAYVRNGGVPSRIFVLPEEMANSDNHKWLVQQLMDAGQLVNRHGNMVLAGKVEVNDLEKDIKDMEYKELALYLTSNIAYALRVPVSRIPYLIGNSASSGDAGGLADSGYWSMIESDQRTLEMHLNSQLFSKHGFIAKFKKRYKIDSLRETQAFNFRVDAVTKMRQELNQIGHKIKKEKLISLLSGIGSELSLYDIEEMSDEEKGMVQGVPGKMGQSFMPDKQVNRNPDQIQKDTTKRKISQNNVQSSSQSGY